MRNLSSSLKLFMQNRKTRAALNTNAKSTDHIDDANSFSTWVAANGHNMFFNSGELMRFKTKEMQQLANMNGDVFHYAPGYLNFQG